MWKSLRLEAEAGLFTNSAADAFTSSVLPVLWRHCALAKTRLLWLLLTTVWRRATLSSTSRRKHCLRLLWLRSLATKGNAGEGQGCPQVFLLLGWTQRQQASERAPVLPPRPLCPFFMAELSLSVHVQKSMSTATTNWWNSQDLQQAIYTAHFPQHTVTFPSHSTDSPRHPKAHCLSHRSRAEQDQACHPVCRERHSAQIWVLCTHWAYFWRGCGPFQGVFQGAPRRC